MREFYPHNTDAHAEAVFISAKCSKGGVEIGSDREIDKIEACISSSCVFATHLSNTALFFPTELVLFKYTIKITAWQNGLHVHHSSLTCPSHPICEVLHCSLCIEKIYNTRCWTNLDILLITSIYIILLSCYWILKPVIFVIKKTMKLPLRLLNFLFNLLRRNKRETARRETNPSTTQFRTYTHRKRQHRSLRHPAVFVATAILVYGSQQGNCCSDVISVVSTTRSCSIINSTETCTFNEGATLTLQPLGQDVCLSLRNQKDEHIGLISLRAKRIRHICHKRIEFFTRDHELNSESSHRCYRAGSCQPDKCDNTKSSDIIPEFSWKASNHPGFTFYTASCQCIT
ncbi:hypothetical protein NECAME_18033 [Necator americanus]|uniref:Phlebovirus glycoprotein G2 fusion domain-containing protein n=1 Tax=Necator americanus TaxID=51031 RepID=W2TF28_NECAM|nr:hypothetical protein NECAME_18033 [Necator americanus]ETN80204.1 hypothetical protein NECAME_18033 [Necator americanus]